MPHKPTKEFRGASNSHLLALKRDGGLTAHGRTQLNKEIAYRKSEGKMNKSAGTKKQNRSPFGGFSLW